MPMNDQEIIDFAMSFRDGILSGHESDWLCFAISAPLQALLSGYGIDTAIVEVDLGECNHVFLKLKDGRVLDPTADQFNWCNDEKMPPVYLGTPMKIHGA